MLSSLQSNPFPSYHNQPLALTITEINNPQEVIDHFLSAWRLSEVRYVMKEWLYEAYGSGMGGDKEFLFLHDELIRLVEAVFVVQQKAGDKK